MDSIRKSLAAFGLTDRETEVYLASLQLGQDTVIAIARKAGIKRTTAYTVLESLVAKGLIHMRKTPKVTLYGPANPKTIATKLKNSLKTYEETLPDILSIYNDTPHKPRVRVYEHDIGYQQITDQITDYLQKGKEVLFYGGAHYFLGAEPERTEAWKKECENKRHKVRELYAITTNEERAYFETMSQVENPNHQIRQIDQLASEPLTENAVYGDSVVIFSSDPEIFALVIESKQIAATYRTMFEYMWQKT